MVLHFVVYSPQLSHSRVCPDESRRIQPVDASTVQVLVNAISRADTDIRRGLYASIHLAGGSTLVAGFGDRLMTEVPSVVQLHHWPWPPLEYDPPPPSSYREQKPPTL